MRGAPTRSTRAPSTTIAAAAPPRAERQPRLTPAATTMVRASTISTRLAADTATTRTRVEEGCIPPAEATGGVSRLPTEGAGGSVLCADQDVQCPVSRVQRRGPGRALHG